MSNENMEQKDQNVQVEDLESNMAKEKDMDSFDKTEKIVEEEERTLREEIPSEDEIDQKMDQEERYQELQDQFMRLQADFANFKRRTANEKTEYLELGIKKIAMDILPVLDNFERALENVTEEDAFFQGIEMIMNQLIEVLKKDGIVAMEALGEKFDPNYHNAVSVAPSDVYDSDHVIEVLQKGYFINDKTLRPAQVIVSK